MVGTSPLGVGSSTAHFKRPLGGKDHLFAVGWSNGLMKGKMSALSSQAHLQLGPGVSLQQLVEGGTWHFSDFSVYLTEL